jgi:hypothetical protein
MLNNPETHFCGKASGAIGREEGDDIRRFADSLEICTLSTSVQSIV